MASKLEDRRLEVETTLSIVEWQDTRNACPGHQVGRGGAWRLRGRTPRGRLQPPLKPRQASPRASAALAISACRGDVDQVTTQGLMTASICSSVASSVDC
jgi:hypothetical protein